MAWKQGAGTNCAVHMLVSLTNRFPGSDRVRGGN